MPVNNILGSSGGSPIDLYKVSQSNSQSAEANSQQAESVQRSRQKEEIYSVEITQEAIELQKQEKARQAENDQELQKDREVRAQADKDIQKQQVEARKRAEQKSIDLAV